MSWKATAWVRLWSFLRVPTLWYVRPSVLELTNEKAVVRIPFRRRTRNHLGSMYFGVLCMGADCAGGLIAMKRIRESGEDVSLIFKDFNAEFLKRAEGPVHFTCSQGEAIGELVGAALASGERQNMLVNIVATVPSNHDEPVARFVLTLSLKKRG